MRTYLRAITVFALVAGASVLILYVGPENVAHLRAMRQLMGKSAVNGTELQSAMPYFRGLVDQKAGHFTDAEAEFAEALQTRHAPFAGAHLAEVWLKQGRYDAILSYLEAEQRLDDGLARKVIAAAVLQVPSEAIPRWFEVVTRRYPGALLLASQNFKQAARYEEAIVWSSAVKDPAQHLEASLVIGISSFYLGRLDQSENVFEQLYETYRIPDVEYWYGRLLTLNGRPHLAVPILESAVRNASVGYLPWALRELGSAYALAGRCKDAEATFVRSIEVEGSIDNQKRIRQARTDVKSVCDTQ